MKVRKWICCHALFSVHQCFNETAPVKVRKSSRHWPRVDPVVCFNETAPVKVRKSPAAPVDPVAPVGFNETAPVKVRKSMFLAYMSLVIPVLQ